MKRWTRLGLAACLTVLGTAVAVHPALADSAATCTATLTIFTTSTGTVTTTGHVTHVQASGVAGQYTAGFLNGYAFTGSQDIMINNVTQQSELHGSYTASGPAGTFLVSYNGHADLTTGVATGNFVVSQGTAQLSSFHWSGAINAQMTSFVPPTFNATDSGTCKNAPGA